MLRTLATAEPSAGGRGRPPPTPTPDYIWLFTEWSLVIYSNTQSSKTPGKPLSNK